MNCKEFESLIDNFLDGMLTNKQAEVFIKHIKECSECYEELEIRFLVRTSLDSLNEKATNNNYNFKLTLEHLKKEYFNHIYSDYKAFIIRIAAITVAEITTILFSYLYLLT